MENKVLGRSSGKHNGDGKAGVIILIAQSQ